MLADPRFKYMHSPSKTERLWFSHLLESQSLPSPEDTPLVQMDANKKKRIHELLARSEVFDHFLQLKFPNLKRVCPFLGAYIQLDLTLLSPVWIRRRRIHASSTGFVIFGSFFR